MDEKEKIKVYYATDLINNSTDLDQEISSWMKYWESEQKKKETVYLKHQNIYQIITKYV